MSMTSTDNSSSNSGVDSGSFEDVVLPAQQPLNRGDPCKWYANLNCAPRTCYDCLNTRISNHTQCALNLHDSACVTFSSKTTVEKGYYPASEFQYCSEMDDMCAACEERWIEEYRTNGTVQNPTMCTGASGCICLALCELPGRTSAIIANSAVCTLNNTATTKGLMTSVYIGLSVCVGLAFLWRMLKKCRKRDDNQEENPPPVHRRRQEQTRDPLPRGQGQLNLSGWASMREKLIDSERVELGRIETTTVGSNALPSPETTRHSL